MREQSENQEQELETETINKRQRRVSAERSNWVVLIVLCPLMSSEESIINYHLIQHVSLAKLMRRTTYENTTRLIDGILNLLMIEVSRKRSTFKFWYSSVILRGFMFCYSNELVSSIHPLLSDINHAGEWISASNFTPRIHKGFRTTSLFQHPRHEFSRGTFASPVDDRVARSPSGRISLSTGHPRHTWTVDGFWTLSGTGSTQFGRIAGSLSCPTWSCLYYGPSRGWFYKFPDS